MSDALYLSLWYPNLRLAGLADKLVAVLSEFAKHGGEPLVYSATVWPVSWSESPVFQQVYGRRVGSNQSKDQIGAVPRDAVEEGLEHLHDDYAYEFQIGWSLWELEYPQEAGPSIPSASLRVTQDDKLRDSATLRKQVLRSAQDDGQSGIALSHLSRKNKDAAKMGHPGDSAQDDGQSGIVLSHLSRKNKDAAKVGHPGDSAHPRDSAQDDSPIKAVRSTQDGNEIGLDPRWVRGARLVRVTGFGPLFDEGAYEQEGHIRIDFGSDAPFLEEEAELDPVAARYIEENVRQLVELTAAVEKVSGATARLLWSELGESLAQRLAARLGQRN